MKKLLFLLLTACCLLAQPLRAQYTRMTDLPTLYIETFDGQSTFILPVDGQYIFMADIWRPHHPIDARYIWLPIEFEDGKPVVRWRDEWEINTIFKN